MPPLSVIDEISLPAAAGRGHLSPARLEEHLRVTVKRLEKFGVRAGDRIASVLPEGPDAATARLACERARCVALDPCASVCGFTDGYEDGYEALLLTLDAKLLLTHPGKHPARDAARKLGIPIANVLRHFEAGLFTLESDNSPALTHEIKTRVRSLPLVLIAPGLAFQRLASRLDQYNPVIGITPPSLEHLPPPHTIEHVAAECVRMLRRYRPHGPYALAGWRAEGLVALEMGRLLDEEGEQVAFVALLDATDFFYPPLSSPTIRIRRVFSSALGLFRRKYTPRCEFMAEALREYRPHPWYGKILHIRPGAESEWCHIAPHGLSSYEAPDDFLAEPNIRTVAEILAAELGQLS